MTHRGSPRQTAAKREWDRFVKRNGPVITATGLPAACFSSVDHFDDFLSHGRLEHHLDASRTTVESLNADQYLALTTLTESYFEAGYEWFTPLALRPADQDRLRKRFAG